MTSGLKWAQYCHREAQGLSLSATRHFASSLINVYLLLSRISNFL